MPAERFELAFDDHGLAVVVSSIGHVARDVEAGRTQGVQFIRARHRRIDAGSHELVGPMGDTAL
jgi:hypothetical protein